MTLTLLWQVSRRPSRRLRLYLVLRALRRFRAPDERDIPQSACGGRGDVHGLCRAHGADDRYGDRRHLPGADFVAVLGASDLTFAFASSSQKLPD